jgi:hypothetical protein
MSETPLTPGVGEFDPSKGGPVQGALCFTIYTSLSRQQAITVQLPKEVADGTVGQAIQYAVHHSKLTEAQKMAAASIQKIVDSGKEFTLAASDGRNSYPVRRDSLLSGVPSLTKTYTQGGTNYSFRTVEIQVSQRVDGGRTA